MLPSLWNRGTVMPIERLFEISREMDRLFENGGRFSGNGDTSWVPPMDVIETADEVLCQLEVPGLSRDNIDIRVENNLLTIAGEKTYEQRQDEKESGYRHSERRYGRFERSFTLPRTIDADRVKARYDNGVLTLSLPKAEQSKPRKITIEGPGTTRQIEK